MARQVSILSSMAEAGRVDTVFTTGIPRLSPKPEAAGRFIVCITAVPAGEARRRRDTQPA